MRGINKTAGFYDHQEGAGEVDIHRVTRAGGSRQVFYLSKFSIVVSGKIRLKPELILTTLPTSRRRVGN
jgi:hypothetical protein